MLTGIVEEMGAVTTATKGLADGDHGRMVA
jgi:hypothetical protein